MKKILLSFFVLLAFNTFTSAQDWCGNSYMTIGGTAGTWYHGSGASHAAFHGADLGAFEKPSIDTIVLGGELQVYPKTNAEAIMYYKIDTAKTFTAVNLTYKEDIGNNSKHYGEIHIDISQLSIGTHSLEIYFQAGNQYDSNNSANYKANFTITEAQVPKPTWCGLSYITIQNQYNNPVNWYNGSNTGMSENFNGKNLGELTQNFMLGGELQVFPNFENLVKMWYRIDDKSPVEVSLPKIGDAGNNSKHYGKHAVSIDTLSGGTHTLSVWFQANEGVYDSNNSANYTATFSIPAPPDTTITWAGNSFISVNEKWYTGSSEYLQPEGKFDGKDLGELKDSFTLGGELQIYKKSSLPATMWYSIDSAEPIAISLPKVGDKSNNSKHQGSDTISIASLAEGNHTLAVWFQAADTVYDSNNGANYNATFTVPADTTVVGPTDSIISWAGNSFITVNHKWYTGSSEYLQPDGKFDGKDLGELKDSFTLGGELQVYKKSSLPATMWYSIDSAEPIAISLPKVGDEGNNSKHSGNATVSIASLAEGNHTLAVWFQATDTVYDSNLGANYNATFTVPADTTVVVPTDSIISWAGNSFITVNHKWYTGSNEYLQPDGKFDGKDLGELKDSFTLGGELQVYKKSSLPATMWYSIDSAEPIAISLPKVGDEGNNSKHHGNDTISIASLAEGNHTLSVWFQAADTVYDSNNGINYNATFTIPVDTTIVTPPDTTITWCGNSFITINDKWYTGSNEYLQAAGRFDGVNLGEIIEEFTLGGELQVYPKSLLPATMWYSIDNGIPVSFSLPYIGEEGNNSKHYGTATISVAELTGGLHYIEAWFQVADTIYDSNGSTNFKASFTVVSNTSVDKIIQNLKIFTRESFVVAEFDGEVNVKLYTASGQLITSQVVATQFKHEASKGIYILKLNGKAHKVLVR